MNLKFWCLGLPLLVEVIFSGGVAPAIAQSVIPADRPATTDTTPGTDALCPPAVLSRLQRHTVTANDTLATLARQYNLIPATLLGFNPSLRTGALPVGREIIIPPYNGVRVELPGQKTWQDVAEAYGVRADVLFEANGCGATPPQVVFIPGLNWSPYLDTADYGQRAPALDRHTLRGYPLPTETPVVVGYGWRSQPSTGQLVFNSGVVLFADAGTPVLAVGDGIVAFADSQGDYGNLVVVNHANGLQTRYAHLQQMDVTVGQRVSQGAKLGTVGDSGIANRAQLQFEVRSQSTLGWVAQDPQLYIPRLQMRQ